MVLEIHHLATAEVIINWGKKQQEMLQLVGEGGVTNGTLYSIKVPLTKHVLNIKWGKISL